VREDRFTAGARTVRHERGALIQCDTAITEYGFLAKHPTTGSAIQSPYVAMSQNYMAQTNRLWYEIFQIVKENCTADYTGANPQDDVMERLLTARKEK